MKLGRKSRIRQRRDRFSRPAVKRIVIHVLVIAAAIGTVFGPDEGKVPSKAQKPKAIPTPVKVRNVQPTVVYYFDLHFPAFCEKFSC